VLDYGSGNLRSAERALMRAGAEVTVTAEPSPALSADGLVVPGVGAFAACVAGLRSVRGDWIVDTRLAGSRPVLGICVGMQVMFELGVEHGMRIEGCRQWPGAVERLSADVLPHMGWNKVRAAPGSRLFAGLDQDARFYFVHSYAVRHWVWTNSPPLPAPLVSWAHHGEDFVAAVEHGPLSVTQFHPEKSGDAGAELLRNWVKALS
jgi:glutamine amidotransferase